MHTDNASTHTRTHILTHNCFGVRSFVPPALLALMFASSFAVALARSWLGHSLWCLLVRSPRLSRSGARWFIRRGVRSLVRLLLRHLVWCSLVRSPCLSCFDARWLLRSPWRSLACSGTRFDVRSFVCSVSLALALVGSFVVRSLACSVTRSDARWFVRPASHSRLHAFRSFTLLRSRFCSFAPGLPP